MTGLPYFADDTVTLHHCDALSVLAGMPDGSVDCIVTSPPYLGLRDYGVTGTDWPAVEYTPMHGLPPVHVPAMTCPLGLEPTPAAFVAHLVLIFRECRRVLADDGTLFLNLGDSYSTGRTPSTGESPKNLLGIPWQTALALQADRWILRNDVIWAKSNGRPESVRDRLTGKHEHIFLFAKSPRYYFNLAPIREPHASEPGREGANYMRGQKAMRPVGPNSGAYSEGGRNPGDVWTIPTVPFSGAHLAVMPPALAEKCILAGCKPGGTVLDPFSGSGTTGMVAARHGLRYVGIDASRDFLDLSLRTRLRQGALIEGDTP